MHKYLVGKKDLRDFIPVDAGFQDCTKGYSYGPKVRDYYLIHYVDEGCGTFRNDKALYEVKKGEAFLIRPGEVTYYEASSDNPWSYIWIGFNGKLSETFASLPDIIKPDGNLMREIKNLPEAMLEERLCAIIFNLYCDLFEDDVKPDYVNKVKGYINARYMEDIKIAEIADSLNLNRKYLSSLFKKQTGITMQEYLIRKRLAEGKKLLENGHNVTEAAHMAGYADAFGFSKAFRAFFGKTPKMCKNITK